jgi:hypothetical protein
VDGEGFTKVLRKKKLEQPGKGNLKEITNKLNIRYAVNEGQKGNLIFWFLMIIKFEGSE